MKSFFKNVFANIVAIVIIFFVFFIFIIGFIAISAISESQSKPVKKNSVLTLSFKTNILDSPSEEETSVFDFGSSSKNVLIFDMIKAIEKAKTDDKIKGISIETDDINAGVTQIDNLRKALEDFKTSGKFVYAYGNSVSQSAYYLGSVADQYYLHPAGGIDLKGLATEVTFFKDFAEKYGIGIDVIRHGKYKAAVEPFIRNDISEENRTQLSTLLNDIWSNLSTKMAASRKIAPSDFQKITDSLYGMIPESALKHKLADQLIQKSQYDDLLKKKTGTDTKEKLNSISFYNYINSTEDKNTSDQIGILYASGNINNGEGYSNIHSVNFIKEVKKLKDDESVKAVVLRVNSPGGSANASDEILFELQQLRDKKPLIVSFGDYAASGGYYISMAANKIYSEPNTITGSIGVFGVIPNYKTIANKNGIHSEIVSTNSNSKYASALHGISPYGIQMITKSVEGTYARFVNFVSKNRKKTFEAVDEIGGGRVWSGTRAKEIGLVDELGTLNDAVSFAAKKANLKKYSVESYPKKRSKFEEIFGTMDEEEISARYIKNKIGTENYNIIQTLTDEKQMKEIKMMLPFRITFK